MKATSRESFESIKPELSTMQQQIVIAMQGMNEPVFCDTQTHPPILDRAPVGYFNAGNYYQIEAAVKRMGSKWNIESVRKRLPEMVRAGVLKEVGTNIGDSGRRCTVYQLVAEYLTP